MKTVQKKRVLIGALVLLALILLFLAELASKTSASVTKEREEVLLEERLSRLIETLDGVSRADVMVTLDSYGNEKASPSVRGVSVVCHGKKREDIKVKVTVMVATALGITSDKIFVSFP